MLLILSKLNILFSLKNEGVEKSTFGMLEDNQKEKHCLDALEAKSVKIVGFRRNYDL